MEPQDAPLGRRMIAMKIGILGSGPVGRSLGKGFASKGHDVKLGSRTPEKQEVQI